MKNLKNSIIKALVGIIIFALVVIVSASKIYSVYKMSWFS